MKIAPLIHSRTLKCDYNMKFAVRPKDFNDSLIYWARSVILPATGDLDFVNNVRQIVASKGEIKFAGIVCTMKYFVENLLDGDEQNRARNYSRDNANRNFGVFLGYSFKAGNEIPDVNYSDLWKMFERYLVPKWDWEIFDTPQIDYEYEVRGKKSSATIAERVKKINGVEINGVEIYESSLNADENLFENYLARSMKKDLVFCSALEQFQPIADGIYTAVTTSASIITRLESRRSKTDSPKKKQPANPKTSATSSCEHAKSSPTHRKFLLLALLILLIIFAVSLIFMISSGEDDSEQNLPSNVKQSQKK